MARTLNLLQVPTGCVWQLPNPVFGEICLILEPFWPGTHTEFVSDATQVCLAITELGVR